MIRSVNHTLKFSNYRKQQNLSTLVEEYLSLMQSIIDYAWLNGIPEFSFDQNKNKLNLKSLLPTSYLKQFDTWLSARMKQAVGKQAVIMIKAACKKRSKQLYMLKKLQFEGKSAAKLQSKIDRQPLIKPNASNVKLELDSRFIDFSTDANGFDFIRISSIGNKQFLKLPIKQTAPSKKWSKRGVLKQSIRLSKDNLWTIYEIEKKESCGNEVVGADQGVLTTLTLSNGITTKECIHGHSLKSIQQKLSRCKKGSKGFGKAQDHRKNYINWSLNQINFSNIKEVRLEKIKRLRFKSKSSRYLSHWKYTLIKDKLVRLGEEKGFLLSEVSNEFRSQRCSSCGWVRKANRKGKTFCCRSCGYTADADLNAASNLKLDLYEIFYWVRLQKINREGFYWDSEGIYSVTGERIVSQTEKAIIGNKIPYQYNYDKQ